MKEDIETSNTRIEKKKDMETSSTDIEEEKDIDTSIQNEHNIDSSLKKCEDVDTVASTTNENNENTDLRKEDNENTDTSIGTEKDTDSTMGNKENADTDESYSVCENTGDTSGNEDMFKIETQIQDEFKEADVASFSVIEDSFEETKTKEMNNDATSTTHVNDSIATMKTEVDTTTVTDVDKNINGNYTKGVTDNTSGADGRRYTIDEKHLSNISSNDVANKECFLHVCMGDDVIIVMLLNNKDKRIVSICGLIFRHQAMSI